jgi:hypothetical protein
MLQEIKTQVVKVYRPESGLRVGKQCGEQNGLRGGVDRDVVWVSALLVPGGGARLVNRDSLGQ